MPDNESKLTRRNFLEAGSAALAAAGVNSVANYRVRSKINLDMPAGRAIPARPIRNRRAKSELV